MNRPQATRSRVDLHAHTTASDGTLTPAELVAEAVHVRLDVLGITDHDSTEGIGPALGHASLATGAASGGPALKIIPGIEVNCDVPDGEVHVLGYFRGVPGEPLQGLLRRLREARRARARGMADKMAALGKPLAFERIEQLARGGSIGRPHVARAMLESGHVATIGEAFDKYIGRNGPAYVERMRLSPVEAVVAIRQSGGVPVLAHPYYYDEYGTLLRSIKPERLLPKLVAAGLRGVEAYYAHYPAGAVAGLARMARKYGLIATGGSDYHGALKPAGLGSVFVPWEAFEALQAELERTGEKGQGTRDS